MCTHEQRCIDGIISASGLEGHTRPEQATVLGVARSQLLAVIAGRELPSVIDRIAEHTGSTPDELRLAMKTRSFRKLNGEVEGDETFLGGKAKNMHAKRREKLIRGRGAVGKAIVQGLLERSQGDGISQFRGFVVPNTE